MYTNIHLYIKCRTLCGSYLKSAVSIKFISVFTHTKEHKNIITSYNVTQNTYIQSTITHAQWRKKIL